MNRKASFFSLNYREKICFLKGKASDVFFGIRILDRQKKKYIASPGMIRYGNRITPYKAGVKHGRT